MSDHNPILPYALRNPIRIGSRASKLAMAQAHEVKARLHQAFPLLPDEGLAIIPITTSGDEIQDKKLNTIGGKGLFIKEIEEAMLAGKIDLAVHSMKDMPAKMHPDLVIPAILQREDPRDALIGAEGTTLAGLPQGATIGTSSLRREAQLRAMRPDLNIVPLRGNVQTRLEKLQAGEMHATVLAVAGLKRLHLQHIISEALPMEKSLPAVAQGAIGIECPLNNLGLMMFCSVLNHMPTSICVTEERAFMARMEGNCRTPIAAYAEITGEKSMKIEGLVAAPDGSRIVRHQAQTRPEDQVGDLGRRLADSIIAEVGLPTLQSWRDSGE